MTERLKAATSALLTLEDFVGHEYEAELKHIEAALDDAAKDRERLEKLERLLAKADRTTSFRCYVDDESDEITECLIRVEFYRFDDDRAPLISRGSTFYEAIDGLEPPV